MMVAHARERFEVSYQIDPKRIYAYSQAEFYAHRGRPARDALALATGDLRLARAADKTGSGDAVLDEGFLDADVPTDYDSLSGGPESEDGGLGAMAVGEGLAVPATWRARAKRALCHCHRRTVLRVA